MKFRDLNLSEDLLQGLEAMNFEKPTPIQEKAIPVILEGKDLIACAQTGTGKTAAFVLPVVDNLTSKPHRHLNTLILAPTRELAQQIDQQIEGLSYFTNVSSIAIYGGGDGITWDQQKKALKTGVDIIIATPGRLIALLMSGDIDFENLEHLVLDEADRMLDMGFYDDIMRIIKQLPVKRQTLMFSATMPPKIRQLAKNILHHPIEISLAMSKPAEGINQLAYLVFDYQKERLLRSILRDKDYNSIIIFASTKDKVKKIDSLLQSENKKVSAFHSDLDQAEREKLMRKFKNKEVNVLVGTDILSRGIDVDGIDLVINFDTPKDPEDYVHRIGRTARASSTGTAITFINDLDQRNFKRIEQMVEKDIPKIPLPSGFDKGPEYQPNAKPRRFSSGGRPGHTSGRSSKPNWKNKSSKRQSGNANRRP